MVRLLAERSDTKSNVKLGGFRSKLQASYVSSHTEELWYKLTVSLWMTLYIYIYICVCVCEKKWSEYDRMNVVKTEEIYVRWFVYFPTRLDFKILSEYKNIRSKLFLYEK